MKIKIVSIILCFFLISIIIGITGSANIIINKDNTAPNPPIIDGPTSGNINKFYSYFFTITDPDTDDRLYMMQIDFGEGEILDVTPHDCDCGDFWENGARVQKDNLWREQGLYEITARVQDVYGEWSEWSEPYPVSMPRVRLINSQLFQRFIELFPILEQILA